MGRTVASVIVAIFSCWVGALVWGWFIVPLGAPALNALHVLALRTVKSAVLPAHVSGGDIRDAFGRSASENRETQWQRIAIEAVAAVASLGVGYLLHATGVALPGMR